MLGIELVHSTLGNRVVSEWRWFWRPTSLKLFTDPWRLSQVGCSCRSREIGVDTLGPFTLPLSIPFTLPLSIPFTLPLSIPFTLPLSIPFTLPLSVPSISLIGPRLSYSSSTPNSTTPHPVSSPPDNSRSSFPICAATIGVCQNTYPKLHRRQGRRLVISETQKDASLLRKLSTSWAYQEVRFP
jgi:hypothetical protein